MYIGGSIGPDDTCSVGSMAMELGNWQHEPDMPLGILGPKVSEIAGTIYVLDSQDSKSLFKMITGYQWSERASLPVEGRCYGVSMTSASGKLFVAGGENFVCAWYQPDINMWCTGQ